jgi:hypothetical protein
MGGEVFFAESDGSLGKSRGGGGVEQTNQEFFQELGIDFRESH